MLTDIFAFRYSDVPLRETFEERDRRLIVQTFKLVQEIYPSHTNGKTNERSEGKWKIIHDRLSTELGLKELSPRAYSYPRTHAGKAYTQSGLWPWDYICEQYICKAYQPTWAADPFIKNRISFVEIAFREREEDIKKSNARLPAVIVEAERRMGVKSAMRLPGNLADGLKASNDTLNVQFNKFVDELNTRFYQARYPLNYHNGFIQIVRDEKIEQQIEAPFWALVSDPKWKNVDADMKEAVDLRDTGGRNPAWHATKALESTIKIISDEKRWTHGGERGAANYVDNLVAKDNGSFIVGWEAESLRHFFKHVRNPFGHGAGSADMPALDPQQTDWAIEYCMTWIKSLIKRL